MNNMFRKIVRTVLFGIVFLFPQPLFAEEFSLGTNPLNADTDEISDREDTDLLIPNTQNSLSEKNIVHIVLWVALAICLTSAIVFGYLYGKARWKQDQ